MKKTNKLTESDLKRIVGRILSEMAMGVPDNITQVGNQLYNIVVTKFSSEFDLNSSETIYKTTIRGEFRVKDFFFDVVNIELKIDNVYKSNSDPDIAGATVMGKAKIKDNRLERVTSSVLDVVLRFYVGDGWNLSVIMDLIKNEKTKIESMLTHEIMHKYDHFKDPTIYAGITAEYNAFQEVGINKVPSLNHFMHLLYYISEAEERTRPSEFYSQLQINNVTKEEFKEFFDKSDMITILRECRDYTFSKLVNDLHNEIPGINAFLKKVNDSGQRDEPINLNSSDINKISETLNLVWILFGNLSANIFFEMIKSDINPFRALFDPASQEVELRKKQEYIDEFQKRTRKFKTYREFFENEIKRLNIAGEKTIRKISKLYAMVENDKNSTINWELHNKINNTD